MNQPSQKAPPQWFFYTARIAARSMRVTLKRADIVRMWEMTNECLTVLGVSDAPDLTFPQIVRKLMSIDLDLFLTANSNTITTKVGVEFDDNSEPTAGFVIVGKDSQQFRMAEATIQARALTKGAHKNTRIDLKKAEDSEKFVGLLDEQSTTRAASVVVDWFGFTQGGQEIPFDAEKVSKLFAAKPTWRDKVLAALEVEESFLPK